VKNAALYTRGVLAAIMVVLGVVILVRVLPSAPTGGMAILPGVVLGGAMIALGVHRISLIVRVRRLQ